jgi:transposase
LARVVRFEASLFSKLHGGVPMVESCASKFHQLPDVLWERIEPLLPNYKRSCKGGRPRLPLRNVVTGILYVLRTGCQWKAMPTEFGSGSAIHAYFQKWVECSVFAKLWQVALEEYDDLQGIDWEWQSLDGAMAKAPLGGEKNWEKPDGSRQARRQTLGVDRRSGHPARRGHRRRQCA